MTVSDQKYSRILAYDATGLKQHNRASGWTKVESETRFCKDVCEGRHADHEIVALSVTDESVSDRTEFRSLPGQSTDAIGAKGIAGDASRYSKDPGPETLTWEWGDGAPPLHRHCTHGT